jgi:hypothetical protein
VALHGDAWKVGERGCVSGDNRSPSCPCRRSDQKVVCSSRPTLASHDYEKLRMGFCDLQVVVDNRNRCDDVCHELLTSHARRAARQLDPDAQLGDGDRRDRDVVIFGDLRIYCSARSFSVNQIR